MKQTKLTVVVLLVSFFVTAQKNWSPEQSLKIKNISAIVPSPDGSKVLYTVREALMTEDRSEYINQVWLCNADGSNHTQLTKGDKNSSNPDWSPDGKRISFTSARDGKTNLWLLPVGGGEFDNTLATGMLHSGFQTWYPLFKEHVISCHREILKVGM